MKYLKYFAMLYAINCKIYHLSRRIYMSKYLKLLSASGLATALYSPQLEPLTLHRHRPQLKSQRIQQLVNLIKPSLIITTTVISSTAVRLF